MLDDRQVLPTRRQLIKGGFSISAAGTAFGTAGLLVGAGQADAEVMTDAQLLVPLIGTEMLAAFGYQQILSARLLSPRGNRLAQRLMGQEHEHLTALSGELQRLAGTPPTPITTVAEADRILTGRQSPQTIESVHNEHDAIILLARLEWMLEGAYIAAIKQLQAPRLLRLSGQILANEGQHATMLSELLHPGDVNKAVPSPNVLGTA